VPGIVAAFSAGVVIAALCFLAGELPFVGKLVTNQARILSYCINGLAKATFSDGLW